LVTGLIGPATAFAHYPFPCSQEEKQKAALIDRAVKAPSQASVDSLTALLAHKNPRIQTAATLGLMRLPTRQLDFRSATAAIKGLTESKRAFVKAAAEAALILLHSQTPIKERRVQLVKLTESKEGYRRRMAVEALRAIGDRSVLRGLEALSNDRFGDHDDTYDMKANARVAFEVWWQIRTRGIAEKEKLPVLVQSLRLAEPFWSRWGDAACDLLEKEGEKAAPLLIPLLTGKDRRSKLWAVRTLKYIGGKDTIDILLDVALKDVDSDDRLVRSVAMDVLVRYPEKRCLRTLVAVLAKSHEPYMRARAATAIGHIDDKSVVGVLRKALSDPEEWVRTQAAAQLARKGLRDGDKILLRSLGSYYIGTRNIALRAMPFIKDQDKLKERLHDLLKKQSGEEQLSQQKRILLSAMRRDVLRELSGWDKESLRRVVPALRALLRSSVSQPAGRLLKKLGYKLKWRYDTAARRGWYEVVGEPD